MWHFVPFELFCGSFTTPFPGYCPIAFRNSPLCFLGSHSLYSLCHEHQFFSVTGARWTLLYTTEHIYSSTLAVCSFFPFHVFSALVFSVTSLRFTYPSHVSAYNLRQYWLLHSFIKYSTSENYFRSLPPLMVFCYRTEYSHSFREVLTLIWVSPCSMLGLDWGFLAGSPYIVGFHFKLGFQKILSTVCSCVGWGGGSLRSVLTCKYKGSYLFLLDVPAWAHTYFPVHLKEEYCRLHVISLWAVDTSWTPIFFPLSKSI